MVPAIVAPTRLFAPMPFLPPAVLLPPPLFRPPTAGIALTALVSPPPVLPSARFVLSPVGLGLVRQKAGNGQRGAKRQKTRQKPTTGESPSLAAIRFSVHCVHLLLKIIRETRAPRFATSRATGGVRGARIFIWHDILYSLVNVDFFSYGQSMPRSFRLRASRLETTL
jgi:hypothetical protein